MWQDSLNTSSITDSGGSAPNDSVVSFTTSFATVVLVPLVPLMTPPMFQDFTVEIAQQPGRMG